MPSIGLNIEEGEFSHNAGANVKWCDYFWKWFDTLCGSDGKTSEWPRFLIHPQSSLTSASSWPPCCSPGPGTLYETLKMTSSVLHESQTHKEVLLFSGWTQTCNKNNTAGQSCPQRFKKSPHHLWRNFSQRPKRSPSGRGNPPPLCRQHPDHQPA